MGEDVRARYKSKEIPEENNFGYIASTSSSSLAASHTETHASFSTGSVSETRTEYGYTTRSASMAFGSDRLHLKLPEIPSSIKIGADEASEESREILNFQKNEDSKQIMSVMFNTEKLLRLKK